MFGLGSWEILIILVLLLVIFGAGRLPAIGRSLGETARELRGVRKTPDPDTQSGNQEASTTPQKDDSLLDDVKALSNLRTTRGKLSLLKKFTGWGR